MKRKIPQLSIIIVCDNQPQRLLNCIKSINKIQNIEMIIVNNFYSIFESENMNDFLTNLNDPRIVYYQSSIRTSDNNLRNIAIQFSLGSWLYFINDNDIIIDQFSSFISRVKFNPQNHFYRIQIIEDMKKRTFKLLQNSKYYSTQLSTFIISSEWFKKIGWQFDNDLEYNSILPFISYLYNYKNVNYLNIKKVFAIDHKKYLSNNWDNLDNIIVMAKKTFNSLLKNKDRNYKQYILMLMFNLYSELITRDKYNQIDLLKILSDMSSEAKIWFGSYLPIHNWFFFKTFKMRWQLLSIKFKNKKNK